MPRILSFLRILVQYEPTVLTVIPNRSAISLWVQSLPAVFRPTLATFDLGNDETQSFAASSAGPLPVISVELDAALSCSYRYLYE